MLRATLLTLMLAALGLAASAPGASATCIDANPDDNGIGTTGCNIPLAGDCHVLVYGNLPGIGSGCSPIVCVRECVPMDCVQDCDGPATSSSQELPCGAAADALSATLSATCSVAVCEAGPVIEGGQYDHVLSCESFLQCVTEPCPGSGRIEI